MYGHIGLAVLGRPEVRLRIDTGFFAQVIYPRLYPHAHPASCTQMASGHRSVIHGVITMIILIGRRVKLYHHALRFMMLLFIRIHILRKS